MKLYCCACGGFELLVIDAVLGVGRWAWKRVAKHRCKACCDGGTEES